MKIFIGQVYIRPGINYPFSCYFQKWLGEELTKLVKPSEFFIKTYSDEYSLIFRMSAKSEIIEPEIFGPTVFKKDKKVEFTIFLPHGGKQENLNKEYIVPLTILLNSIIKIFRTMGIDVSAVEKKTSILINQIISDKRMLDN